MTAPGGGRDAATLTAVACDAVRALLEDRPLVLTGGPLALLARRLDQVRELGPRDVFLLAFGIGTGPLPDPTACPSYVVDTSATSVVDELHQVVRVLADLPPAAVAALDAWDPGRRALVSAGPFPTARTVGGRRVVDGRTEAWAALEDKTTTAAVWEAAGLTRAPEEVVLARAVELLAAHRRLDEGHGTVWAGDARSGFNGAGTHVRAVTSERQVAGLATWYAGECDRVRVMPYLAGIPCSVNGLVTPDGVAVLRPVEQVSLRSGERFRYAGLSTYWDPSDADREEMRAAVRAVGGVLARDHGYVGGFGVDGVLGSAGWRQTDLNPRFTGGMGVLSRGIPHVPLMLLQAVLVSGADLGMTADELERVVLDAADDHRNGRFGLEIPSCSPASTVELPVVLTDDGAGVHRAAPGEDARSLLLGPAGVGGLVSLDLPPGSLPRGARLGPLAVELAALADEEWGLDLPPMTCAEPAR